LAAPPEFYADENTVTPSVRDLLIGLGYVLHSPAELVELVAVDLAQVCAIASTRQPGTWLLPSRDLQPFEITERRHSPRRPVGGAVLALC
jgi:hypothetical protein